MGTITEIEKFLKSTTIPSHQTKNTINRHRAEMIRLSNLYKRGYITKDEAISQFQSYLRYEFGRSAYRQYPYKQSA